MLATLETLIEAVTAADSFRALRRVFVDALPQHGVTMMSYHHYAQPGARDHTDALTVLAHGFPDAWVEAYTSEKLYLDDPIVHIAQSRSFPFWWSDMPRENGLSDAEKGYLLRLQGAELGEGIAVPVFGPHGRNGYVGLGCGQNRRIWNDAEVIKLQLMSQLGHQKYCRLLRMRLPDKVRLSERECEVLTWVSRGKSNSVIADITGISSNTVDTYLRRIYSKLGVADRVTAALRGVALGLVE